MGFRCGIVGLPNVGKSTLFNALTETAAAQAANYPFCTIEPNVGNVGDMLQRLTNHALPSTTHRVVNPPPERRGHSRYSMPFFLHPAPDFLIQTLPATITAENPNRYPTPITAHDYLYERLVEIGLIKK